MYRQKALMWPVRMEQIDNCKIHHCRNWREYSLPELPHYSVDGYCVETRTVYEFLGCVWQGHTCQPFRDVSTTGGEILADRLENTAARMEQITTAGYSVKTKWEYQFDAEKHADL